MKTSIKMTAAIGFVVMMSLTISASAASRHYEVMPFVGTSLIGSLSIQGPTYKTLDFKGENAYGLALAVVDEPGGQLELLWSRSTPRLIAQRLDNGPAEEFDVRVDRFLINALQVSGSGSLQPFASLGVGATLYRPRADRTSETRFTMAIGTGFKWFLTPTLGLRVDGRWAPDIALPKSSYFCEDNGTSCYTTEAKKFFGLTTPLHWLHYFDATAGVVVRF